MLTIEIDHFFWNNEPDTFCGRIAFKLKNRTIWSESAKVHRLTRKDAKADAKELLSQIKERNVF
jgi:hypothetical protein